MFGTPAQKAILRVAAVCVGLALFVGCLHVGPVLQLGLPHHHLLLVGGAGRVEALGAAVAVGVREAHPGAAAAAEGAHHGRAAVSVELAFAA